MCPIYGHWWNQHEIYMINTQLICIYTIYLFSFLRRFLNRPFSISARSDIDYMLRQVENWNTNKITHNWNEITFRLGFCRSFDHIRRRLCWCCGYFLFVLAHPCHWAHFVFAVFLFRLKVVECESRSTEISVAFTFYIMFEHINRMHSQWSAHIFFSPWMISFHICFLFGNIHCNSNNYSAVIINLIWKYV